MIRSIRVGLALVAGFLLISCGGGGGGGGSSSSSGGSSGGSGGGGGGTTTPPATGIAINATLQQGSYWEFAVNTETTTFAQPSSTSSSTDFGIFRVTLGTPTTIGGATVYPVNVTGTTTVGNTNYRPRWTHVGIRNGSVVGSTDGATLQTIYDAATLTAPSKGFFIAFGAAENVTAASTTFTGAYNTLAAVSASHGSSSGGCETILGLTLCSDTSTSFSEREYYKDGVGPVGYKRDISYSSSGGNFFTSTQIHHTIEITATSLAPTDGSVILPAPWREVAPMATARYRHSASVFNGEIYVFGGLDSSNANLSSVEIYNPTTDTWRPGVSAPVGLASYRAHTIGTKTYLINQGVAVQVFDHNTNTWSTGAVAPFSDPSFDTDIWIDTAGGHTFILTLASKLNLGSSNNGIEVYAYEVSQTPNIWYVGTQLVTSDYRWFAMRVLGNSAYVAGGFRQFLSSNVTSATLRYDASLDQWASNGASVATLRVPRYFAQATTLNGSIYLLGGRSAPSILLRDMESYSATTNTWTTQPKMLRPRSEHAVVTLGGKIYAIGGGSASSSTPTSKVDVFTP